MKNWSYNVTKSKIREVIMDEHILDDCRLYDCWIPWKVLLPEGISLRCTESAIGSEACGPVRAHIDVYNLYPERIKNEKKLSPPWLKDYGPRISTWIMWTRKCNKSKQFSNIKLR